VTKKKETKRERFERIHRESENQPIVKELRELIRRGKADIARREAAGEKMRP
jgi:hypothetical protein